MSRIVLVLLCFLLFVGQASACEVCFGDPNDPQTKGMNGAIITMVIITYLTITGMFTFFVIAYRRARAKRLATAQEASA